MDRTGRRRGLYLALAVALVVSACASVKLVSDYDDQIDSGLSQMNEDTSVFVTKMIAAAKTPAGTYQANTDFYIKEDAKIDTLIVRAESHRVMGSCPAPMVIDKALAGSKSQIEAFIAANPRVDAAAIQLAFSSLATVKDDDCGVGLLRLVRSALDDLQTFHREQAGLGIPASARDPILVGGLGSTIRTAITVEIAEKSQKAGS